MKITEAHIDEAIKIARTGRRLSDGGRKTAMSTAKVKTLRQFVKESGGQEAAARIIGVSFVTVNRWLHGHDPPRGLSLRRLGELGISV